MPKGRVAGAVVRKKHEKKEQLKKSQSNLQADDYDEVRAVSLLRRGEFSKMTHRDVVELFQLFDLDIDGSVSFEEISTLLEKFVPEPDMHSHIEHMLMAGDRDGNGLVSVTEFLQALKLGSSNEVESLLRMMHGDPEKEGCSEAMLKMYLKKNIKTSENCISLPFYLVFFGLIWLLTLVHLQVFYTHRQNVALRTSLLTSTKVSVNWWKSSDELWDWMDIHIIPALFGGSPKGRLTTNNQVFGGLLLEKRDAETIDCLPRRLQALYGDGPVATCYGDFSNNEKVAHWFPVEDPLTQHHSELQKLRKSQWLSNATRSVDASLITYNGQNGFLTHSRLNFAVEDGGSWLLTEEIESFSADPYDSDAPEYELLIFLDVLFVCMATAILVLEVKTLIELKCSGLNFKTAFFERYLDPWKFIDWVNILQSYACVIHWATDVLRTLGVVADLLSLPKPGEPGYDVAPTELYERSYQSAYSYKNLRWYVTVFTVTSMLRFFKAFQANERLNIVTRTIIIAAKDLAHFAVVFFSILFAFVLMGHLVFGPRVSHFSRLTTACDSCVMMLVGFLLDDIRADMLQNTGSTGVAWIYAYILIMQLLLVNMILVVIFDVYAEVKGDVQNAPTLYEQAVDVYKKNKQQLKRAKKAREILSKQLNVVASASFKKRSPEPTSPPVDASSALLKGKTNDELEKMINQLSDSKIFNLLQQHGGRTEDWTTDSLTTELEGLSESQAKDLITNAKEFEKAEMGERSLSMYDAVRLIARVDANVQEIMLHWQAKKRFEALMALEGIESSASKYAGDIYTEVTQQVRQSTKKSNGQVSVPQMVSHDSNESPMPPKVPPEPLQVPAQPTEYHDFHRARIVE